jgi:uncharacterized membrane protein YczE
MRGTKRYINRIIVYCTGVLFLAMGVVLSVKSDLGISPVNSLPYVISRVLDADQGTITTITFGCYVLMQIPLMGHNFKIKSLLQIGVALLFGFFITNLNKVLVFPIPGHYVMQLILLGVSILSIAAGLLLYIVADIVPQPAEGLMLAIQKKTGWKFSNIKTSFDCTSVLLALLVSVSWGFGIIGIREGTIIAAVSVGKCVGLLSRWFRPYLRRFCFASIDNKLSGS